MPTIFCGMGAFRLSFLPAEVLVLWFFMQIRTLEQGWYCLCTLPKKETIAAENVRATIGCPVFAPRIVYRKRTKRGWQRFNEALFPGYLFAQCDLAEQYRYILSLTGIRQVVHYGEVIPVLPDVVIAALRESIGGEIHEINDLPIEPGTEVKIIEGPLQDLTAVVKTLLPGRERVRILLEFLGQLQEIEISAKAIYRVRESPPSSLVGTAGREKAEG